MFSLVEGINLKKWIWDKSVKKIKLFGLKEIWWDLNKRFVSNFISVVVILIFLVDKIIRLEIIKNKILIFWVWIMNYYFLLIEL